MQTGNSAGDKYLQPASAPASRNDRRPAARAWRVVGRVALWCLGLLGACGLLGAWQAASLALLPVTPLEPLTSQADLLSQDGSWPPVRDGARVRVEGFLRGEPPLQANRAGWKFYALQKLSVTLLERRLTGGRYSSTRRTIALKNKTPRLWLCARENSSERVEVRLPRLWDGEQILLSPIWGTVGDAGTIPNNVFEALAVDPVQPEPGQEWELWTVPNNARVTVVATARLDTGRVVLEIERGLGCALSPDPWPQMTSGARSKALGQLTLAFLCLSPLAWKGWKWARRRRLAAST